MAINPSYDFALFDVPSFSPLLANELGASTSFSAHTPTWYTDFSLGQLIGLTQPNNSLPYPQQQFPAIMSPYEFQPFFQQPQGGVTVYPSGTTPPELGPNSGYRPPNPPNIPRKLGIPTVTDTQLNQIIGGGSQAPYYDPTTQKMVYPSGSGPVGGNGSGSGSLKDYFKDLFANLPAGSGVFLAMIAIIALVIMFAASRKKR